MKKYILLSSALAILFFSGCSSKKALDSLNKDRTYVNSLRYTQKCDIVKDNKVEIMFTAIYLNRVNGSLNSENEKFVIGIYVTNTDEKKIYTKLDKNFTLLLNNEENISIEPILKESGLTKTFPLYNPWADYYEVQFPVQISPNSTITTNIYTDTSVLQRAIVPNIFNLKLELNHDLFGSCFVSFSKE